MRQFDFLGKAKYFVPVSLVAVLTSIVLMIPQVHGLTPGLDFTGGTEFTVKFSQPVETSAVRNALSTIRVAGADLSKSQIQDLPGRNTKVITTQLDVETDQATVDKIEQTLKAQFPVEDKGVSRRSLGQQVSREIVQKAWQAILLAIIVVLIYMAWRFRLRYAVGAVAAVVHDVTIALGIFAVLRIEIDLTTIAALLTVLGYSLNDTIVIFDRVRENVGLDRKATMHDLINRSINQSLSRTLTTATAAALPLLVLLILGGPVLRGFSVALLVGVTVGTYSTFYVANPILYWWSLKAGQAKKTR